MSTDNIKAPAGEPVDLVVVLSNGDEMKERVQALCQTSEASLAQARLHGTSNIRVCAVGPRVPLYRLWKPGVDHLYTIDPAEAEHALTALLYKEQIICGAIAAIPLPGTVPLFRTFDPLSTDHSYTIDPAERDGALAKGYVDKGIVGYVMAEPCGSTRPLYRSYNDGIHDHFYTTDKAELDAMAAQGWVGSSIAAHVWANTSMRADGTEVADPAANARCDLGELIERYDWRSGAKRAIFVMSDAPLSSTGDGQADALIAAAKSARVTIHTFFGASRTDAHQLTQQDYARIAEGTGGMAFVADNAPHDISHILRDIVCACVNVDTDGLASPAAPPPPTSPAIDPPGPGITTLAGPPPQPSRPALLDSTGALGVALERLNRAGVVAVLERFAVELDEHCKEMGGNLDAKVTALRVDLRAQIDALRTCCDQSQQRSVDIQRQLVDLQKSVTLGSATIEQAINLQKTIEVLQAKLVVVETAAKQLDADEMKRVETAITTILQNIDLSSVLVQMKIEINGQKMPLSELLAKLTSRPVVKETYFGYGGVDLHSVTFVLTDGTSAVFLCTRVERPELRAVEYVCKAEDFHGLPAEFTLRFIKTTRSFSFCDKTVGMDQYDAVYQSNVVFTISG